jgi:hypothetical protein
MSLRLSLRPHGPDPEIESKPRPHPSRVWIWRILYILYSLEVGVFLLFLPWLDIWENNYLLFLHPRFRPIVVNSFLKGGVLGLGIVNILIGIQEIANCRKRSKSYISR